MHRRIFRAAVFITAALTSACTSTSPPLSAQLQVSQAQQQRARDEAARLLAQPLNADDAVALALIHSRALQAALAEHAANLSGAQAQARLPNPVFAFERLVQGDHKELTRVLTIGLTEFITWPQRQRVAQSAQQAERLRSASAIVQTTLDARRAWVEAVSAQQKLSHFEDVLSAAQAAATLAQRMHSAGNFNRVALGREQRALLEARNAHTRAQFAALAAREALLRTLSLTETQAAQLQLPPRLPDLPPSPEPTAPDTHALRERLDMQLAQAQLHATARDLGLTRVTSWIDGLQLSGVRKTESASDPWRGYAIELPLPLFDWGDARRDAAQALYLAQLNRTAQTAIEARSQLVQAHHAYRSALEIAQRHQNELAPLRQSLAEEAQLLYNGMQLSVFDLLAQAREHAAEVVAALDAQREFWLAQAQLAAARAGLPRAASLSADDAPTP